MKAKRKRPTKSNARPMAVRIVKRLRRFAGQVHGTRHRFFVKAVQDAFEAELPKDDPRTAEILKLMREALEDDDL